MKPSIVPYILRQFPDMTGPEVGFLREFIRPGCRVWEWGSGGSTLWLLSQGCHVTSIEHMKLSYDLLLLGLSQAYLMNGEDQSYRGPITEMLDLRYVPAAEAYNDGGEDDGTREHFTAYVDSFPGGNVDVVLVDGRARMACLDRLRRTLPRPSPGLSSNVPVLLHDAHRFDYSAVAQKVNGVGALHHLRFLP